MEGTPTPQRQRDPSILITLTHASDEAELRSAIVGLLSSQIQQADIFVAFRDPGGQSLQFEAPELWLTSFLEQHASLTTKLELGELTAITHKDLLESRHTGGAIGSSVLLVPMTSVSSLHGVIGIVSLGEGKQPSMEELESARYVAQVAAPVAARLQQLARLMNHSREFDSLTQQLQAMRESLETTERQNGELQATIRMRAHLQTNLAHELRTPLAAIRGYSRMILDGRAGEITSTQRDYLTVITNNTSRLIHLLNWMSQINDQSALHLTLSDFDLAELWSERVDIHEDRLREKSIAMQVQIPNESFALIGDRQRLTYVLDTLLSSAVRFARENSNIVVQFSHGREKDITVKISSDSGDAISPELVNHAFDSDTEREASGSEAALPSEGNELNLSGVRDAVGVHGGRVFLINRAGEGSTFIFTLPAVRKDGEERPGNEQAFNSGRRRR